MLLLPVIGQSRVITARFNWLWMQGNITYWRLTYWMLLTFDWRPDHLVLIADGLVSTRHVTQTQLSHGEIIQKNRSEKMLHQGFYRGNLKDPLCCKPIQICFMTSSSLCTITGCSVLPRNNLTKSDRNGATSAQQSELPSATEYFLLTQGICELPVYKT